VKTSGDACGTSSSFGIRQAPAEAVPVPQVKPNAPRLIEASIPTEKPAQKALVQRPRRRDQSGADELNRLA